MPDARSVSIAVRSADGTPIGGHTFGEGSPALVIVPGALSSLVAWEDAARLLATGRTVIVLDRRGHGATGDPPVYEPEREVEDVLAVLETCDGPADLLGHSSGAIIALHAATGTPLCLRRLAVYEPPVFLTPADRVPSDLPERLDASLAAGDPAGAIETFLREGPRASEAEIADLRSGPVWPYVVAMAETVPHDARVQRDLGDRLEALGDIGVLTLMVIGGASPARMRDGARAVAAWLSISSTVELDGQQHMAMLEAPDAFAAAIDGFLTMPDV